MRGFAIGRWLLFAAIILLLPGVALSKQSSLAEACRERAEQYRAEARQLKKAAADLEEAAARRRRMAADARKAADSFRKRGNKEMADKNERDARNDEVEAFQREQQADSKKSFAAKLTQMAADLDEQAKAFTEGGKRVAKNVLDHAAATMQKARDDLSAFKKHIAAYTAGKQSMPPTAIYSYSRDQDLYTLTPAKLDEKFKVYEDSLAALAKSIDAKRAELAKPKPDMDALMRDAYADLDTAIRNLVTSVLTLEPIQYDCLYAQIYIQEQKLIKEYQQTEEALRKAHTPYLEMTAKLDALKAAQGEARAPTFNAVATQFQADMLFIRKLRQDWIADVKRWHDDTFDLAHGADVHRKAAEAFAALLDHYFTEYKEVPKSFGLYLNGSDVFGTSYENYAWCKARPFPDIQQESRPDLLHMGGIMAAKVPNLDETRKINRISVHLLIPPDRARKRTDKFELISEGAVPYSKVLSLPDDLTVKGRESYLIFDDLQDSQVGADAMFTLVVKDSQGKAKSTLLSRVPYYQLPFAGQPGAMEEDPVEKPPPKVASDYTPFFTPLYVNSSGSGEYHINRYRVYFRIPKEWALTYEKPAEVSPRRITLTAKCFDEPLLARDFTLNFATYFNGGFEGEITNGIRDVFWAHTIGLNFWKQNLAKAARVELNGKNGPFSAIGFEMDVNGPNLHNDWVAIAWQDPMRGFAAQTLHRMVPDWSSGKDPVIAAGTNSIFGTTIGPKLAAFMMDKDADHFLAGRRSWVIGRSDDDYGLKLVKAESDVYYLETAAIERYANWIHNYFTSKDPGLIVNVRESINKLWVALLRNYVAARGFELVDPPGSDWKMEDGVYLYTHEFKTLNELESSPDLGSVLKMHPALKPQ